jgi:hypothetical protein
MHRQLARRGEEGARDLTRCGAAQTEKIAPAGMHGPELDSYGRRLAKHGAADAAQDELARVGGYLACPTIAGRL